MISCQSQIGWWKYRCLEDESYVGMRGFLHVDTVLNQNGFQPPLFLVKIYVPVYICIYIYNTVRNLELSIFDCMFHRDFIHSNLQKKQCLLGNSNCNPWVVTYPKLEFQLLLFTSSQLKLHGEVDILLVAGLKGHPTQPRHHRVQLQYT